MASSNNTKSQAYTQSHNKSTRRSSASTKTADGLENVVSGLGTVKDKSSYNRWVQTYRNADWEHLTARFREDWVSQKVCTIIPQDMVREWRKVDNPNVRKIEREWGIPEIFRMAYQWARLYGTSFVFLDLKGTGSFDTPLDIRRLKPGCIKSFQMVDRLRMTPCGGMCLNPLSPHYGLPEYYQLVGYPKRIHYSRILRFEGTELPLYQLQRNQWYSDSVLIPLEKTIDQFMTTSASAAQLSVEACIDVVTVQGLQGLLTDPEGEAAVLKRLRLMKQAKSVYGVLILDETESYDTKSIALSGVKDLMN
ncbi:DUF1073 domain-containing protein [Hafnia alvei]|nr:anti-CBASS Acb1 family protein [Hafnia alvei]MBI0275422.1 DUF1073 domain-containing protein [Hafnia alvei]PNK98585.1 hypothetical protein CEQ28_013820 [Hafnia alvei]